MKGEASYPLRHGLRGSREHQRPAQLPDLHQGHAPITLHNAFHDALELFEDWRQDAGEPRVYIEGNAVPISFVFAKMLGCTDLMPLRTRDALNSIIAPARNTAVADHGDIYSRGARLMLSFWGDLYMPGTATPDQTESPTFGTGQMRCADGFQAVMQG